MRKYSIHLSEACGGQMRAWKGLTSLNKCQVPTRQGYHVVLGSRDVCRRVMQALQRPP